ncbi:GFA family protein [Aliiroseovarius crassostreae]|uniref:GFA family protein n=1 Tax=Aliiroseovarius crassostreae TaxID=154981 RepID=UPI003C79FDB8
MDTHSGGCLCGNIRFTTTGSPLRVGICHCVNCRKHHGALFYAAAIYPQDAVQVEGKTNAYQGRHFCPTCGSSAFAMTGDEIELHLGALDQPNQFTPDYELWTERRENWLPEFPDIPSFPRNR